MDTEEVREIEHHKHLGRSQTDEGPYYHESWWESYKGAVKGLLGGLIIGGGMGLLMGGVTIGLVAAFTSAHLTTGAIASVIAGFAGLGAVLGAHEFSHVGTVTGAVAAAHEKAESRMKEFENSRFAELKREIRGLRASITGGRESAAEKLAMAVCEPETPSLQEVENRQNGYRTEHCDSNHCGEPRKFFFWRIAAVAVTAGAAAGALLGGFTPLFEEFMHPLEPLHLSGPGIGAIVGAAAGLTFSFNRDIFREVQQFADRAFKGFPPEQAQERAVAPSHGQARGQTQPQCGAEHPVRLVMEPANEPRQHTAYFTARLDAEAAKRALHKLDPTRMPRN